MSVLRRVSATIITRCIAANITNYPRRQNFDGSACVHSLTALKINVAELRQNDRFLELSDWWIACPRERHRTS
jgi:hypothetical protein